MASKVTATKHKDQRANIPTEELRDFVKDDERTPKKQLYPVMQQTGGCRKARWARGNRGKSGGIRAIFYYYVMGDTVYMIDAYPKNEKENLTSAEKSDLKKLSKAIERAGV